MPVYHLAQLNIVKLREPLDSPLLVDFVNSLDRINTLAEQAPGYIWRLKDDLGNATAIRPFGDDIIVNMSVWLDVAALREYTYKSAHTEIMRRRREWFHPIPEASMVMWWVPEGHEPTLNEAAEQLAHLRQFGPSAKAFTFKDVFAPQER
jgi:hypothetical protein